MINSHPKWRMVTAALLALLATPATAAGTAAVNAPPDTILLFVASWCAPCHVELREIAAISHAASPRRVLVVPIDSHRNTVRMLARVPAAQILQVDESTATAIMQRLSGGRATGLPTTVVTDRMGRACAVYRRPLTPQAVAELATRCA